MGKKKDKKAKKNKQPVALDAAANESSGEAKPKLKRKEYEALLEDRKSVV